MSTAATGGQRLDAALPYELTEPRQKPFRCKEEIVVEKEYLVGEDIRVRPVKCAPGVIVRRTSA
jgi:hypothetical protein